MLSEEAKLVLRWDKKSIGYWQRDIEEHKKYLSGELELSIKWKELKDWKKWDDNALKSKIREYIEIREEILNYLRDWIRDNEELRHEIILYHPFIEREIWDEELWKPKIATSIQLSFFEIKIILAILGIIYLFTIYLLKKE